MRTYSKLLSIFLMAGLTILYSCNSGTNNNKTADNANDSAMNNSDDTSMPQTDNTATTTMTDTTNSGMPSDGEVLTLVMTTDMNEINAANEAQKKKVSKPVMDYAKMMITEHTKNMDKGKTLSQSMNATAMETPMVTDLKRKGEATLAMLAPMDGKKFEAAYIDAMIKGHTEALAMIDEKLSTVKDEALKNHLTETRGHVAMHLEQANKLKSKM